MRSTEKVHIAETGSRTLKLSRCAAAPVVPAVDDQRAWCGFLSNAKIRDDHAIENEATLHGDVVRRKKTLSGVAVAECSGHFGDILRFPGVRPTYGIGT